MSAPPEGGKANAAVEKTLAHAIGVPKSAVRVVRGHSSRVKQVEIDADEGGGDACARRAGAGSVRARMPHGSRRYGVLAGRLTVFACLRYHPPALARRLRAARRMREAMTGTSRSEARPSASGNGESPRERPVEDHPISPGPRRRASVG